MARQYYSNRVHNCFGSRILEAFCIAFEKLFFGSSEIEECNAILYDIEKEIYERKYNIKHGKRY